MAEQLSRRRAAGRQVARTAAALAAPAPAHRPVGSRGGGADRRYPGDHHPLCPRRDRPAAGRTAVRRGPRPGPLHDARRHRLAGAVSGSVPAASRSGRPGPPVPGGPEPGFRRVARPAAGGGRGLRQDRPDPGRLERAEPGRSGRRQGRARPRRARASRADGGGPGTRRHRSRPGSDPEDPRRGPQHRRQPGRRRAQGDRRGWPAVGPGHRSQSTAYRSAPGTLGRRYRQGPGVRLSGPLQGRASLVAGGPGPRARHRQRTRSARGPPDHRGHQPEPAGRCALFPGRSKQGAGLL